MKSQRDIKGVDASIVKALKDKLSINNIFREFDIVANMTRNLEIKWKAFARLEPIRHLPREEMLRIIKALPFLIYIKDQRGKSEEDRIRIQYENSKRVLLVTGITKEAIDQMLIDFNANRGSAYFNHPKAMNAKVIANNGFWATIETNAEETAFYLKKFMRNRKKANDNNNSSYKLEGKRIRIVILQEDFFSILVDAMTELKSEAFRQSFFTIPLPSERRKSQDEGQLLGDPKRTSVVYRSMILNYGKSEMKEEEFSDGFSESNSLNSDILDAGKLKDLIETSEQGIQSQSNADYQGSVDNTSEQEEKKTPDSPEPSRSQAQAEQEEAVERNQILREEIQEFLIDPNCNDKDVSPSPKKQFKDEPFSRKPISANQIALDDPFVVTVPLASPPTPPEAAIQTQDTIYSSITFTLMKRLLIQFKQIKTSQLVELPQWMQSESEEERSRHKFFGSLCRPKIAQRRCSPFQ